ncbi:hypothetical protein BJ878DRAFT_424114, partial [Calycina marina]
YPWLEKVLNMRSPRFLKQTNKTFRVGNCKIGQVQFRNATSSMTLAQTKKQVRQEKQGPKDIGPLGVFAIRHIEGERYYSCVGVSVINPSKLLFCDSCHARLAAPYQNPQETVKPSCCDKATYCSTKCYIIAATGDHKVI